MNDCVSTMGKTIQSVWVICKYGSPPQYGVTSKPYKTAKFFSESGFNTYLITSDSNHLARYPQSNQRYNWEKDSALTHIWIKTLKYKNSASLKRILSWLSFEWHLFRLDKRKLEKPDAVIVSSLSLLTVLNGIYLKKKYNCKFILEIRDIYPLTLIEELGVSQYNPVVWLLKQIERMGYRNANLIVGTMPNLTSHIEDVLGYKKEVFFSPLGINSYWERKPIRSARVDALFPENDCIIIGYAGSMGRTNALDSFISTIESLETDSKLYFVMVGQGDQKDAIERRLRNCKNVTIGSRIEQDEIPYFLSKCDILYLATHDSKIWDYGQSMNKLVDYMMAGKPVVASYSGYPSMLNEAGSGLFVRTKSAESIVEGIRMYGALNADERNEIGKKGTKWIKDNYSNDRVCKNYMDRLRFLTKYD